MAVAQVANLEKEANEKEKSLREGGKAQEVLEDERKRLHAGNAELRAASNPFNTAAAGGSETAVAAPTGQPARNKLFTH